MLLGWSFTVLLAFWFFFFSTFRPFNQSQQPINTHKLSFYIQETLGTSASHINVVHWLNPDCDCVKFSQRYFKQLLTDQKKTFSLSFSLSKEPYSYINEIHTIVFPPGAINDIKQLLPIDLKVNLRELTLDEYKYSKAWLPSTPAAIILPNNNQDLAYLGPHTSGYFCGSGSNLISTVLNNLQKGMNSKWLNTESEGCFCEW